MSDTRQKMRDWFKNEFERETFRHSMGEIKIEGASSHTIMAFFAAAIAERALGDSAYETRLVEVHHNLLGMLRAMQDGGVQDGGDYWFCLLMGCVIEKTVEAVMFARRLP